MPSQTVIDKARRLRAAGGVVRQPRPDEVWLVPSESRPYLTHAVSIWRDREAYSHGGREVRKATCTCEHKGEVSSTPHPTGAIVVNRQCAHLLAVLASR